MKPINELKFPESEEERKNTYERLIAQMMTRVSLPFPEEDLSRCMFISQIVVPYKENKKLAKNFHCKWGKIDDPVTLLKSLKNETWELRGVKKFFDFYTWRREAIRKEKEEWREIMRSINADYKRRLKSKKKLKFVDDNILRDKLEQELNDYGKKYGVKSYIEYVMNWRNKRFEIKGTIGIYSEWATYTCSIEEMKKELQELIRESRKYPDELKEIEEEIEHLLSWPANRTQI